MQAIYRLSGSAISLISMMLLSGCSSTPNVIPNTGPNTLAVYETHVSTTSRQPRMYRPVHSEQRDLAGYTRDASNEINLKFPRLPNPELVLFVFPHLSPKGRPVPGYSTSFMLYEKDEYALPGEVAP